MPVVSFLLLLSSGAAADPAPLPGLAALTADMLDEGSGPMSALDIEDALSSLGAQFETEVGSDATVLSLLTLPRFAGQALGLLADIVVRPRLAAEDFDRVRELRLNRLRQLRDLAPAVADLVFARVLYAAHPYGRLPIGTMRGLEGASAADVRGFHADAWRPSQVTIVAVGDASHDELFGVVERAFAGWADPAPGTGSASRRLPRRSRCPRRCSPPRRSPSSTGLALRSPSSASARWPSPRLTPDYYALLVLNTILGGQFVSRLNMNLREDKGYTYGVRSGFEFRRAPGPFSVQAAVQTGRHGRCRPRGAERTERDPGSASGDARGTRAGQVGADERLRAQLRDGGPDRAGARAAGALRSAGRHARAVRAVHPRRRHRRRHRSGASGWTCRA